MLISQEKKLIIMQRHPKDNNKVNYQKFYDVLFNNHKDIVNSKGFRYIDGYMKTYEQEKKGLSFAYHKKNCFRRLNRTTPLNI